MMLSVICFIVVDRANVFCRVCKLVGCMWSCHHDVCCLWPGPLPTRLGILLRFFSWPIILSQTHFMFRFLLNFHSFCIHTEFLLSFRQWIKNHLLPFHSLSSTFVLILVGQWDLWFTVMSLFPINFMTILMALLSSSMQNVLLSLCCNSYF